jgi:SAM-dependent methyltransferase
MTGADDTDNRETLVAYERLADRYAERTGAEASSLVDELVALMPVGSSVLELGSGPGTDAAALEHSGFAVERTDGALSFVDRFRRQGFSARVLDFYADDFGGPYDAVFANAVLLHAARERLAGVLSVALKATRPGGVLAATVKKGTGDEWSTRKLDAPRHFTYWQEHELDVVLRHAGWMPIRVVESTAEGARERWITITARRP